MFWGLWSLSATDAWAQIPSKSRQIVVVVSPDWQGQRALLQRFERPEQQARQEQPQWLPVGPFREVVLGRKGLGWGRGLFAAEQTNGDFRHEGDERSPAGIFALGTVFGLATERQADQWLSLKMPYLHLSDSIRCVGDNSSDYYNQLVDLKKFDYDGQKPQANEYMRLDAIRDEGAYRWGIFVRHNREQGACSMEQNCPPAALDHSLDRSSGSCIFMHIWKGPGIGTSGCTALAKRDLLDLINWLDEERHPVLVQLSWAEYQRLQRDWQLPAISPAFQKALRALPEQSPP